MLSFLQLCIPAVLQSLSMLAATPKMAAVNMRLLTALWKIQVDFYALLS